MQLRFAIVLFLAFDLAGCGGAGLYGASTPGMQPPLQPLAARLNPMSQSAPFSDNFSGTKLNPGWLISNPNPDSTIGLNGNGFLEEKASPLNGGSDLFSNTNYNAPFIVQPVSPSANWTLNVELKFSPTNDFQGAGVLLATQPGNFTDETQFDRIAERVFGPDQGGQAACLDDTPKGDGFPQGVCAPFTATTTYFNLTKSGMKYTLKVSPDGKTWTKIGSRKLNAAFGYVGLNTIRQPWDNNMSVYSDALFNYFRIKVH